MAYSYVEYTADGVLDTWSFSFSYLNSSYIKVYVDDVSVTFTMPTSSTVKLDSVPASGSTVKIKRETPLDSKLVDFVDGSVLGEDDLDLQFDQTFDVSQEIYDGSVDMVDRAESAASAAETAQAAAETAQTAAETAETNAETAETNAEAWAAGLNMPSVGAGDAGKLIKVDAAETGWELATAPGTTGWDLMGAATPSAARTTLELESKYPKGFLAGLDVLFDTTSSINIGMGALDINGGIYTVGAVLNKTGLTGLTADTWYYVMAAAPGSGTALSLTEITTQTAVPAWDSSLHGYYTGTTRCIGMFLTDSLGAIIPFSLVGSLYGLANWVNFHDASSGNATTFTLLGTGAPAIDALHVLIHAQWLASSGYEGAAIADGACTEAYSTKYHIGAESDSTGRAAGDTWAKTNTSQQILYACDDALMTLKFWLKGFIFNR